MVSDGIENDVPAAQRVRGRDHDRMAVRERDRGAARRRAPKLRLRKAARDAQKAGYAYVVLDGTLIPIDRIAADRPFYSGKHRARDESAGHPHTGF